GKGQLSTDPVTNHWPCCLCLDQSNDPNMSISRLKRQSCLFLGHLMGKWTDKNYITHSEWATSFGGARAAQAGSAAAVARAQALRGRLPFHFCSLSLQPFSLDTVVCTRQGTVYDLVHLLPYLKKYHADPVSGDLLSAKDLTRLHFHTN